MSAELREAIRHYIKIMASIMLAMLMLTGSAQAAQTPTERLQNLAAHATHGWTQDNLPLPELEHRLNSGQRLYITCGTISRLAVRRMQRIGIPARVVSTYTLDKPNGIDDGHILIEVKLNGHWQVYDLDNNRKPVDAHGHGITITQFVLQKHRRFQILTHDRTVNWAGTKYRSRFQYIYRSEQGLQRWYDHVLGVPVVQSPTDGFVFSRDSVNAAHMRKLGFHQVPLWKFARLY